MAYIFGLPGKPIISRRVKTIVGPGSCGRELTKPTVLPVPTMCDFGRLRLLRRHLLSGCATGPIMMTPLNLYLAVGKMEIMVSVERMV